MEVLFNTPTKIFVKAHEAKTSPSSSTISLASPWRRRIWCLKSSNRSCLSLFNSSSRHGKQFHSLPLSNSEIGLGTETAEIKVLQTDGPKVACLRLQLEKECHYGEHFLVVGDDPILGSWNPSSAIQLSWSNGHVWTVDLELPVGKTIQYKFIWKLVTGEVIWQPGPNRIACLGERQNVLIVGENWEDVYAQQIFKQEKPIVDTPNQKIKTSKPKESLMIYDEGHAPVPTEEAVIRELKKSVLASTSCGAVTPMDKNKPEDEGESLINYDEGHVLVPGLTAQMISEESLAKELQLSILANSLNGAGDTMLNGETDIPPW